MILLLASTFFAVVFFNLVNSLSRKKTEDPQVTQLNLIAPVYFLAVFIFGLNVSFLPQFLYRLAVQAHVDVGLVSAVFTTYFMAFVLTLIPAGHIAEKYSNKGLLICGALLTSGAMALMAFSPGFDFYMLFPIRALEGVGQGMLFIGAQSFILKVVPERLKTQGAYLIVFGYNGGILAGTTIGALLVMTLVEQNVFMVGAIFSVFTAFYILRFIPSLPTKRVTASQKESAADTEEPPKPKEKGFFSSLGKGLGDPGFLSTILLIGIPTKAVMAGFTMFALPILLAQQNYLKEDIGQILICYAIGVLLISKSVSRMVDRRGKADLILLFGSLFGGIGLFLVSYGVQPELLKSLVPVDPALEPYMGTIALILGLLTLGFGHGFIHAPVITHITRTRASANLGAGPATSIYRVFERIGHVIGPLLVGYLVATYGDVNSIIYIALATIVFGLLFFLLSLFTRPQSKTVQE